MRGVILHHYLPTPFIADALLERFHRSRRTVS
jgi:hypothetical protein